MPALKMQADLASVEYVCYVEHHKGNDNIGKSKA